MTRVKLRDAIFHPISSMDKWWDRVSPERRLDRNAGNIFMLVGLMMPSVSIVLRGPTPNSALNFMPSWLQIWMCVFIFAGCGLKLHGAFMGFRFYFPHARLANCYRWGFVGAPLATCGAWVYGWYILANTQDFWSAVQGVSTPMFGTGISVQAVIYWLEWRRIKRREIKLTAAAVEVVTNHVSRD